MVYDIYTLHNSYNYNLTLFIWHELLIVIKIFLFFYYFFYLNWWTSELSVLKLCLVKGLSIIVTIRHNIVRLEKNSSKKLLHSVESNSNFLLKCVLQHLETT